MNTEHFRQDHREIHDLVQLLRQMIQSGADRHATKIVMLLVRMARKRLGIYKKKISNCTYLWPCLAIPNSLTLLLMYRFAWVKFMKLAKSFARFIVPQRILSITSAAFVRMPAVFKVLHDRMRFENNELFPLLATLNKV